jgi:hypothetical protein
MNLICVLDQSGELKSKTGCVKMNIRCFRFECEVCKEVSSVQVFIKSNGEISYGRARHKSDKFYYHKLTPQYVVQKLGELGLLDHGQVISKALYHNNLKSSSISSLVAGGEGFEPSTPNLGGWCSIRAELLTHALFSEIQPNCGLFALSRSLLVL